MAGGLEAWGEVALEFQDRVWTAVDSSPRSSSGIPHSISLRSSVGSWCWARRDAVLNERRVSVAVRGGVLVILLCFVYREEIGLAKVIGSELPHPVLERGARL
jgi:hypothetical protein